MSRITGVFSGQIKMDNKIYYGLAYELTDVISELLKENRQLKSQLKQRDDVIDETLKEIRNIQEHYHELIEKEYKQEESVFVNKCCKTGFILNVKSYFDLIELNLNKYKGDNK